MATSTADPEKVTSCSHDQPETKEVEYSFSKNKDPGVEPTSSSDEVKFKPNIPATPVIDITDKQAIFAIVSFTLVSVALGFLLYLGTLKDEIDPVSRNLIIRVGSWKQDYRKINEWIHWGCSQMHIIGIFADPVFPMMVVNAKLDIYHYEKVIIFVPWSRNRLLIRH